MNELPTSEIEDKETGLCKATKVEAIQTEFVPHRTLGGNRIG